MKKALLIIPIIFALGVSTVIGVYYYKNLRGAKPAITNPPYEIGNTLGQNNTDSPLELPSGFSIEVFADRLTGARDMTFDQFGNLWVSRTREGIISVIVIKDGKIVRTVDILTGLKNPHGLLFDRKNPYTLYLAEEHRISLAIVSYEWGDADVPELKSIDTVIKLVDLPSSDGIRSHFTRSLAYTSAGELLVSIGSSCNVCTEADVRRASIQKLIQTDEVTGTWELFPYATGLRNSVFMTTNPVDGKLWATEMGRDELGDNIPPDELNIIEEGKNYGWPICYGNRIHDMQFDKNTYITDPCANTAASTYDLRSHVAPLGLAFIPEDSFWPKEYSNDLLVAYHGSWNRSVPVGYAVMHVSLNEKGEITGEAPFIEGWLTKKNEALGRPVDLTFLNGSLYISDDHAGVIYRVFQTTPITPAAELIMVDGVSKEISIFYDPAKPTAVFAGEARGTMFFEGSFPVVVTDDTGVIVAEGTAHATGEWMTENFVPFSVTVTQVDSPTTKTGKLTFKKSNPSGLPENEYAYTVTVTFLTK